MCGGCGVRRREFDGLPNPIAFYATGQYIQEITLAIENTWPSEELRQFGQLPATRQITPKYRPTR
jgi:hypothetical protein